MSAWRYRGWARSATAAAALATLSLGAAANVEPDWKNTTKPAQTRDSEKSAADSATLSGPSMPPWWAHFDDATLNLLLAITRSMAGDSDKAMLPEETRVATLYLGVRICAMRLGIARSSHATASRQQWLAGQAKTKDPDAAALADTRLAQAASHAAYFDRLLGEHMSALGALLGIDANSLSTLLAPAVVNGKLPLLTFPIPERLPAQILRARPEVAAREAQLHFELANNTSAAERDRLDLYQRSLTGFIEPAPALPPQDDLALDAFDPLVALARREVGHNLHAAIRLEHYTALSVRQVHARQTDYQTIQQQQQSGQATEFEVLERHQQLLVSTDQLAAASSEMANAWIALQYSTGGAVLPAALPPAEPAAAR
jgi:outer membrane protein TolC